MSRVIFRETSQETKNKCHCNSAKKNSTNDVIMTSDYVTVPIKLCSEVGNDQYITLCNFVAVGRAILKL